MPIIGAVPILLHRVLSAVCLLPQAKDEKMGANTIIQASPDFKSIKATTVGVSSAT